MKKIFITLSLVALCLLVVGFDVRNQGMDYPVYTDSDVASKILDKVKDFTHVEQVAAWHAGLELYETPHKKLVSRGESLIALGLGLLFAVFIQLFFKQKRGVNMISFMGLWVIICLVKIPLIIRYYVLRMERFDYHPSADSVLIPIVNEVFLVVIGLFVSMIVIYFVTKKHELSQSVGIKKVNPTRLMLLSLWLLLLGVFVVLNFQDAALGSILASVMAIPMVYQMMVAAPCMKESCSSESVDDLAEKS